MTEYLHTTEGILMLLQLAIWTNSSADGMEWLWICLCVRHIQSLHYKGLMWGSQICGLIRLAKLTTRVLVIGRMYPWMGLGSSWRAAYRSICICWCSENPSFLPSFLLPSWVILSLIWWLFSLFSLLLSQDSDRKRELLKVYWNPNMWKVLREFKSVNWRALSSLHSLCPQRTTTRWKNSFCEQMLAVPSALL